MSDDGGDRSTATATAWPGSTASATVTATTGRSSRGATTPPPVRSPTACAGAAGRSPATPGSGCPASAPAPARQPAVGPCAERGLVPGLLDVRRLARAPRPASSTRSTAWAAGTCSTGRTDSCSTSSPSPPERGDVVEEAVAAIASSGVPSFLAVLKRFGPGHARAALLRPGGVDPGPRLPARPARPAGAARPPRRRWSPTPVAASTWPRTPGCGRSCSPSCTPGWTTWSAVCRRVDPEGVLASDLSRRLGIAR